MSSTLHKLVRERGRLRSLITKLLSKAEEALSFDDEVTLHTISNALHAKSQVLEAKDEEILTLVDDDDVEEETDSQLEYSLQISNILQKVDSKIRNKHNVSSTHQDFSSSVRLPKLQLPTFSGNKLEWNSFWDIFSTTILSNSGIPNVQKFAYLKSVLKGEALSCIAGLSLSDANFDIAVNLIRQRFGDTASVTREHLNKLSTIRCFGTQSHNLRQFYDEINVHVRCLEKLGVNSGSYELMLVPTLLSKLPEAIQISMKFQALNQNLNVDMQSVDQFLKFLLIEITARESTAGTHSEKKVEKPLSSPHTAMSLNTASKKPAPIFCTYCKDNHASAKCEKVPDIESRCKILRAEKRCFKCLRKNHFSKDCFKKSSCTKCKKSHHYSICPQLNVSVIANSTSSTDSSVAAHEVEYQSGQSTSSHSLPLDSSAQSLFIKGSEAVVMPSAKVLVFSPDGKSYARVRLILDTACNRTFIKQDLCEALDIPMTSSHTLDVNTFASDNPQKHVTSHVKFCIKKPDSDEKISLHGNTVDKICPAEPSASLAHFNHFRNLDLADPYDPTDNLPVGILVGSDQYYDIVNEKIIRGSEGPVAVSSKLGWLACGRISACYNAQATRTQSLFCSDKNLNTQLKEFWNLEHLGITKQETETSSFLPDISFTDGHYSVPLPWKDAKSNLPLESNFNVAYRRLQSCLQTLRKSPETLAEYKRILDNQLSLGIIEKVPITSNSNLVHYLPHSAVIRPQAESTKVRIVFDASSRASSITLSLNDCLMKGPCMLPLIPRLLSRFRMHRYGILADIEKAFLQIRINEQDRDVLRFLWVNDPTEPRSSVVLYRYTSLVFGLSCSPAVLEQVILNHLSKYRSDYPQLTETLCNDIYVDNLTTGRSSASECVELFNETKRIFHEGGFNMRQWKSNCPQLTRMIDTPQSDASPVKSDDSRSYSQMTLNPDESSSTKVLGLNWDTESDQFIFKFSNLNLPSENPIITKRLLLQISAKIYDPLGLFSPILVTPKLLFQSICSLNIGWDADLPESIKAVFLDWIQKIVLVHHSVPRMLFDTSSEVSRSELHGFCDASQEAYACAIYLRTIHASGHITSKLVMAKSRVAPKSSPQTIPRLELLGALLLSKLFEYLRPQFSESEYFCWSDSQNALYWIHGTHKVWKTFVQNRVSQIRSLCPDGQWLHVPGEDNPADLPSRGISPEKICTSKLWWNGPAWLSQDRRFWPAQSWKIDSHETEEIDKSNEKQILSLASQSHREKWNLSKIIDPNRFSSFKKMTRVTALVLGFIRRLKKEKVETTPNTQDMNEARNHWIRHLQEKSFQREISHLRNCAPASSINRNLQLFLDEEGVLRTRGRISSLVQEEINCPILVPNIPNFENLLINDSHDSTFHGGVAQTLSNLRNQYWILRGRQKVKKVLRKCYTCRRVTGLSYQIPSSPSLPKFRLVEEVFSTVGLDYCGPLHFRKGENAVDNESLEKCYVLIFTCASTRAVHLELVENMSSAAFLRAFRRFVSRRGIPNIVSDNFSTFKHMSKYIHSKQEDFVRYVTDKHIEWKFTCDYAPWMGGFYERLVKELKIVLKKVLLNTCVSWHELHTILCEVEGVINSRPLTYIDDSHDIILTPAHFLILSRVDSQKSKGPTNLTLQLRYKGISKKVDQFWKLWKERYVLSLRENQKHNSSKTSSRSPSVGDVVVIQDKTPRLMWRTGCVVECCVGRDGLVRSAIVRVVKGKHAVFLKRPIKLLVPVEGSSP